MLYEVITHRDDVRVGQGLLEVGVENGEVVVQDRLGDHARRLLGQPLHPAMQGSHQAGPGVGDEKKCPYPLSDHQDEQKYGYELCGDRILEPHTLPQTGRRQHAGRGDALAPRPQEEDESVMLFGPGRLGCAQGPVVEEVVVGVALLLQVILEPLHLFADGISYNFV